MNAEERYRDLVRSFHTLATAPGVTGRGDELDLLTLDAWAASPMCGNGAREAAAFVLNLWDSRRAWAVGAFNVFHAIGAWDDKQRAAWQAWAANPFRP
jgi:hypothetical protein